LLDAAQTEGLATVSEVSEGGSVLELLLTNEGTLPLFLLDGEELVGAKQNRIVNLSMLVPPETRHTIPVSCVEAGRWNYTSREFEHSDRVLFSRGRARKSADVTRNLAAAGERRTDQSAVWDDVACAMEDFAVSSGTGAVADLYSQRAGSLDELVDALTGEAGALKDGALGAVFLIAGEVQGLELFDHPATWQSLMGKVLRGYAVDALRAPPEAANEDRPNNELCLFRAEEFIESVAAADVRDYPATGEGADLRLVDETVTGGALQARGRLIHLCAFTAPEGAESDAPAGASD
jgi:hypothetical protein